MRHGAFFASMLNELDILRDVSARFESAGIDYMLTGSMAMNYYAQPRMTRDIDLVVALQCGDAERILRLFAPDYYVSAEAVQNSIAQQSLFNRARDSHSELQLRDVRNLIAAGCDRAYIEKWTQELGLASLWQECSNE